MASPVGASGSTITGTVAIEPAQTMQRVQQGSKIEASRLAERLSTASAAPPQGGRGQIVDTFA